MRRSSWLMLVCLVSGCPWPKDTQQPGGGSGSVGGQCSQHEFQKLPAPAPALAPRVACPRKVCGPNGTWLGAGVPFRTLHLHGAANPEGIALLGIADRNSHALTLELDGDVLTAWPAATPRPTTPCRADVADAGTDRAGVCLTGAALTGVSLFLGPEHGKPSYQLTIDSVTQEDFFARCETCSGPVTRAPHYSFTARNVDDGCAIALCDPSLEHRTHVGIAGTLVMFRGDFYDDATYQVSDAATPDRANADGDLFNLACEGTALYKLYMTTAASATRSRSTARRSRSDSTRTARRTS
jgi:hypothetical protein